MRNTGILQISRTLYGGSGRIHSIEPTSAAAATGADVVLLLPDGLQARYNQDHSTHASGASAVQPNPTIARASVQPEAPTKMSSGPVIELSGAPLASVPENSPLQTGTKEKKKVPVGLVAAIIIIILVVVVVAAMFVLKKRKAAAAQKASAAAGGPEAQPASLRLEELSVRF